jgi:anti-sigma-K factor RskA
MRNDKHVGQMIPAYALDCLEENEARLVTEHLETCQVCKEELHAYREVIGILAYSVPVLDTPADVKSKLMGRLLPRASAEELPIRQISIWEQLRSFSIRLMPLLGVVGVVLILVFGVSNVVLWDRVNQLSANVPGSMKVVNLVGTDFTPDASGMIVISGDGEYGTLVVENLPELGEGYQYQLWLIDGDQRTSGGVFTIVEDGYSSMYIYSHRPLSDFSEFGITVEPYGGSPGPTGDKVLGGNL